MYERHSKCSLFQIRPKIRQPSTNKGSQMKIKDFRCNFITKEIHHNKKCRIVTAVVMILFVERPMCIRVNIYNWTRETIHSIKKYTKPYLTETCEVMPQQQRLLSRPNLMEPLLSLFSKLRQRCLMWLFCYLRLGYSLLLLCLEPVTFGDMAQVTQGAD